MEMRHAFARALRAARKANGLTQEDFSVVSSRTYLSILERGQKSPTLDKVHVLSETIGIHMLSLLTLTYLYSHKNDLDIERLFETIRVDIAGIRQDRHDKSEVS